MLYHNVLGTLGERYIHTHERYYYNESTATIQLSNFHPILLLIHHPMFLVNWTAVVWRVYRHTDCCFMVFSDNLPVFYWTFIYYRPPLWLCLLCVARANLACGGVVKLHRHAWLHAHTLVSPQHAAALRDAGPWALSHTCRHQGGIPLPR